MKMTNNIVLTPDDLDNPCNTLLELMSAHLTTPTRQSEIKLFMLGSRCKEIAMLATCFTILELMSNAVIGDE